MQIIHKASVGTYTFSISDTTMAIEENGNAIVTLEIKDAKDVIQWLYNEYRRIQGNVPILPTLQEFSKTNPAKDIRDVSPEKASELENRKAYSTPQADRLPPRVVPAKTGRFGVPTFEEIDSSDINTATSEGGAIAG